jgi:CHASE3 domain sensor protein
MPDGEFTHREIERLILSVDKLDETMGRLDLRLNEAIDHLEERVAKTYVTKEVFLTVRQADAEASATLTEKVNRVSSAIDWAGKLIIGAVILALLGLVLYSNGGAVP